MVRLTCDYCGLAFSGAGYSPDEKRRFCCYGCYLVQRILGTQGEEGVATWLLLRLGMGALLAMNVMMISLVLYTNSTGDLGASAVCGLRWALVILSSPAILILGGPFVMGAARDLRRRRLSTDALIVTGSLTAYGVSAAHVIRASGHVYFDTATMLLLIVTLGRLLEASAKSKTSHAIHEMIGLIPSTARILRGGQKVDIPSAEVRKGDRMIVKPGERLPADGIVVSGECLIEEAAFTGEARPRACAHGDKVFGGSVNCDGLITVEATAVGSASLLAQMQRMVEQAQQERAPVELLAERAASVFVPVVWLLAAAAAIYWGIMRHEAERAGLSALAMLVVACPCALGIATPMAACIAIGKAARAGVLIRSGEILERLPLVGKIFFDKTGTLTSNKLAVAGVKVTSGVTEGQALALAMSLEAGSEHAIARAIMTAAQTRGCPIGKVIGFRAFPGQGVAGTITLNGQAKWVTVGSLKLLSADHKVPDDLTQRFALDELTTTYVGWDEWVRAAIYLKDSVRSCAAEATQTLKSRGIAVSIISGDREGPTERVARGLGIDHVIFECSPTEKIEAIQKAKLTISSLITRHSPLVAMVGDGINDAPALAEADVGIAVGGGTDLARQAGDVTLLGDDLLRIPWMIELARTTYRIIRQNLLWAFGYNSIAIVLAFFGCVHPLIAAAAMFASSLAVIANSMRLLRAPNSPLTSENLRTARSDPTMCGQTGPSPRSGSASSFP